MGGNNKNAFQQDAYHPLQWPPWGGVCLGVGVYQGVSAQGVSAWGCLPGGMSARGCLPGGSALRGVCPVHAGIHTLPGQTPPLWTE